MDFPELTFRNIDPLQDYYQDRDGNRYCVARLIDDAKDLPVFEVPIAALDLSDEIWKGSNIFALAFHVRRCNEADLEYPILLDWYGTIADGRHRIIKALVEGKTTIKVKRLTYKAPVCQKE